MRNSSPQAAARTPDDAEPAPELRPARAAGDSPKSRRTRAHILDTAARLFAQLGYHPATNPVIAEAAGLTRGAMLYHFPTREALIEAVIGHLQTVRSEMIEQTARAAPHGADRIDAAIDAYWRLLHEPAFVAFAELENAARTEPMLRERLKAAQEAFDRGQASEHMFDLVQGGASPRLQTSRDLARFALEGLARARLADEGDARTERLLAVVKRAARMLNRKGSAVDLWPEG